MEGGKCIEYDGELISRSAFERVGGSTMAKWYRSIKVLPEGVSLGRWLTSRGLPIIKGNPRRNQKGAKAHKGGEGQGDQDGDGEGDGEDGADEEGAAGGGGGAGIRNGGSSAGGGGRRERGIGMHGSAPAGTPV
ncbi:hypothetical protein CHLRE_17g738632v5 [Chlamydomonas reinhardtii]|uniref:Uncharacterized protein n=1 Tax=Chlamydomonas reinhardtii TaxID=3055 RepID=A0A2K3CRK5_CHLRE|nr:uncharacterized protein CHLRE_17g738632v5 [Chlamydomonas reinhardtii]PNW70911.1 hypothetical protein CHLRE_17g738632v5 [Chlamydomonas reinhardtii]